MKTLNRMLVWAVAMFAYLVLSWSSWAETAQLVFWRGDTGTSVSPISGVWYECQSYDGYCVRYNHAYSEQFGHRMPLGSTIPRNSWTPAGVNQTTKDLFVYIEFGSGGWPYAADPNKALLVYRVYVPNVGMYCGYFAPPQGFGVTWVMYRIHFDETTGDFSANLHAMGDLSPPYDWEMEPNWAYVTPLFF